MAQITDAQAIRFVNEVIRPMAEAVEALDANVQIAADRYVAEFAPLVSGNVAADTIEDGRAAEGVSRMTLGDVQNFATQMAALRTLFDQVGVRDVIRKPGVRRIIASIS